MKQILLAALLATFMLNAFAQEHSLVKKWETDTILPVPESVLYDALGKVLYVSNIDGEPWGRDGKGSIAKVGLDGKIIKVDWVKGLNCPKGMGQIGDQLFVADLDNVTIISKHSGMILQKVYVPGAANLNDITVDKNGKVYVSDSKIQKVFVIENGIATLFLENLRAVNGILAHNNNFYVLDNGNLFKVNNKTFEPLAQEMEGATDGVEKVNADDFIVSCWSGVIYYVSGKGKKQVLLDSREQKINTADIGYDADNRIVYVPTFFKNSVVAYELK